MPVSDFKYGTITLFGHSFQSVLLSFLDHDKESYNPQYKYWVWAVPVSLATTKGITIVLFSSPYLDVSVQEVPVN